MTMNIKALIGRALAWPFRKSIFSTLLPLTPGEPIFFRDDYRAFSVDGYERNVYVNKSINEVAKTVAGFQWILTDLDGKEILKHPILDLLARPNPNMSRSEFFIWLVSYFLIDGNGFIFAVTPDQAGRMPPQELWPLQPNWIEIKITKDDRGLPIKQFFWKRRDGTRAPIDPSLLSHIMTFNPLNANVGLSPIKAARLSITQGNESKRWNISLLQNHARPPGAFIAEGNLQESARNRLKEEIMEKWSGTANAGKPLFLEGGMKWEQFGLNAADMDWLEGQKISSREIALIFGVPPELIGDSSNKTYSNYKEARRAFYEETILPFMLFLKEEFNTWLVPKFPDGDRLILDFDTDQVAALQEDRDKLFTRLQGATFLTINEKRDIAGFEDVRGGDVILIPLNLVPLGFGGTGETEGAALALGYDWKQGRETQSLILSKERFPTLAEAKKWVLDHDFEAPKVDEKPESWRFRQFPPGRCQDDTIRTITITRGVKAVVCVAKEGRSACPVGSNGHAKVFNLQSRAQKQLFWKQFDRRRLRFFDRMEALTATQLRRDFRAAEKAVADSSTEEGLLDAAQGAIFGNHAQWDTLFKRIYTTVGDDFAREVFNQIKGVGDAPEAKQLVEEAELLASARDLWLEEIGAWLQTNGTIRALGILNTTSRGVRNVISAGISQGLSIPNIARAIADFRGVTVGARARLIARTEVISASNLGSLAAARATNLPLKKEWIATADERVRDIHADADGQIVTGMDTAFAVGGEELLFPGDTSLGATGENIFNCRCTVGYIPIDSEDNVPAASV